MIPDGIPIRDINGTIVFVSNHDLMDALQFQKFSLFGLSINQISRMRSALRAIDPGKFEEIERGGP